MSDEKSNLEDLAALAADLREWLAVQQGTAAREPEAGLPEPVPVETEADDVPHAPQAPGPTAVAAPPPAHARQRASQPEAEAQAEPEAPACAPPAAASPAEAALRLVQADLGPCTRCKLHAGRTRIVFGVGSATASVVFVGEGPGYHEDQEGIPFVGAAGELLTRIVENVLRLRRDDVYICNVVKCRPPGNRNPEPDEVVACSPFLWRQIDAIGAPVVVALGKFAAQTLLKTTAPISALRGRAHPFRDACVIPTFHPAYLLRSPGEKRKTMEDMLLVRQEIERRTGVVLPPVLTGREAHAR